MSEQPYDLVIVGGGMVGATLACALLESGLRIALLEAHPFGSDSQPSYDDRATALAFASRLIYERLGLWPQLREGVEPIHKIHVSDRGHFGAARIDREEEGVEALGYVMQNRVLGRVLSERLANQQQVELITPVQVEAVVNGDDLAEVTLRRGDELQTVTAKLVIVADGTHSPLRQQLGVVTHQSGYGQTAVITNVSTQKPHANVAYERFTDSGPLALLPMTEGRCSVVFSCNDVDVDELLSLDDAAFLARLQQRFGYRLGKFTRVGRRVSYPLLLVDSHSQVEGRILLMGNAARTIHPVAGQGLNLALRDMAALAEQLLVAVRCGSDPGAAELLAAFVESRRADQRRVVRMTDGLAKLFSTRLELLVSLRDLGLLVVDLIPALRHHLARQMMGLNVRLPRL